MPTAPRRPEALAAPRRRPGLRGLLCLGAALASSGGCDSGPDGTDPGRPEEVVYELSNFLPFAEHELLGGRRRPQIMGERGFRQFAGSSSTWSFVLPPGAVLRGRAAGLGPGGSAPGGAALPLLLSIVLRTDDEPERVLLERDLRALGARFSVDVALETKSDQMASLRVVLRSPGAGQAGENLGLDWAHLEIVAPRRAVPIASTGRAHGRNLLLVLFDTLRADRTEPYGSERVATPAMAGLAARGTTFENAFSNASWTAPSVASLFTATYPTLHGVRGVGMFHGLEQLAALSPELPYLPDLLSDAGYATVAVFNNAVISPAFGFGRGFDEIHEFWRERHATRAAVPTPDGQADLVWDRFVEPVLRARGERPFFAYVHEIDPHFPYDALPPYDTLYGSYEGVEPARLRSTSLPMRYRADPGVLSRRDISFLRAQYAGEVTFMDAYLGRLIERLERAGLRESTLVVLVSDHGESLATHLRFGHGFTLYDEVLRVPLIFSLPGLLPEGQRVAAPAQLVDVAPTILDLLGLETPASMQGASLVPQITGVADSLLRPSFAQANFEGLFSLDAVRFGRFKLIRRSPKGGGDPILSLFDLAADPNELNDLSRASPVAAGTLRQMLDWRSHQDLQVQEELVPIDLHAVDERLRSELEALGYVE